nr:hypothetical protein [Deltaproteobacteria bacterium]
VPADARISDEALRLECRALVERHLWEELEACSDRLAVTDPALGSKLHTRAIDEAAAELQLHRLTQSLAAKRFDDANTLVKRIPDDSVYKAEARKRLEAALAAERP